MERQDSFLWTPRGGCCSKLREEEDLSELVREAIDQLLAKKPR